MELANSKKIGIYLTDLQEHRSQCESRKRWLEAHRAGALLNVDINDDVGPHALPTEREIKDILSCLDHIKELCEELGWRASLTKTSLTHSHINHAVEVIDWSSLSADLRNVSDMVLGDMWDSVLVKVSMPYAAYVNSETLISEDFAKNFPSATEDIKEAGNCIAVDCGTAAVFHLMRGVEWGMRALCVDLKVLDVPRKNVTIPIAFAEWERIIEQLNPAVNKVIDAIPPSPQKQELQEFYFPLLLDIRGFQHAFRNHVMHTRQTYSQKAADDILDYVRRFFILLSTRISE
jgi:hypothetical protein